MLTSNTKVVLVKTATSHLSPLRRLSHFALHASTRHLRSIPTIVCLYPYFFLFVIRRVFDAQACLSTPRRDIEDVDAVQFGVNTSTLSTECHEN